MGSYRIALRNAFLTLYFRTPSTVSPVIPRNSPQFPLPLAPFFPLFSALFEFSKFPIPKIPHHSLGTLHLTSTTLGPLGPLVP